MQLCAACECPIVDKFLENVLDRLWHVQCVQCCECKCKLTDKCLSRDGKLYCRSDYYRRYGKKCDGCSQVILPTEMVQRIKNGKVFHVKCFTCTTCRKELSMGEEFFGNGIQLICKGCKDDYVERKTPADCNHPAEVDNGGVVSIGVCPSNESLANEIPSPVDHSDDELLLERAESEKRDDDVNDEDCDKEDGNSDNESGSSANGGSGGGGGGGTNGSTTKRRGPRTTIKAKQLETLKAAFNSTPKPTRHIREQLSQQTGLNMRVIQVWFQNRRSKERRMKQMTAIGARRQHFFRNPRRMRALRTALNGPYDIENNLEVLANPPFSYASDYGENFNGGNIGFYDFFPGQQPPTSEPQQTDLNYIPATPGPGPQSNGGGGQGQGPLAAIEQQQQQLHAHAHHQANLATLPLDSAHYLPAKGLRPGASPERHLHAAQAAAMQSEMQFAAEGGFGHSTRGIGGGAFQNIPPPHQELEGAAW